MPQKKKPSLNKADYEQIGRSIEAVLEVGYIDRWRLFRANFIRGLFFGVGGALGSTLIIAAIIYFLSFFTELPLVGELAETIRNTIREQ
jgi:hypothetical protein